MKQPFINLAYTVCYTMVVSTDAMPGHQSLKTTRRRACGMAAILMATKT